MGMQKRQANFVTLTLNPAWDCTLRVDGTFIPDGIHTVTDENQTAGGKGINVAKILVANGKSVVAAGLAGAIDRIRFEDELRTMGIDPAFLEVPGRIRTNLMIRACDGELKFNRPGFPTLDDNGDRLTDYVRGLATTAPVLVFSGSLPARFPSDVYRRLLAAVRTAQVTTVLDTSGDALTRAAAYADILKPNRREMEQLAGTPLPDAQAMTRQIRQMVSRHEVIIVSDGAAGAWFASGNILLHGTSPDVQVTDTTGAGDTLLGQFCADYFPERRLNETITARALAAGAAAVESMGTPVPDMARIRDLADRVRISAVR